MLKCFRKMLSSKYFLRYRVWLEIIKWQGLLKVNHLTEKENTSSKYFLVATNIGSNLNALAFDITLGLALRSRGHKVKFSLCNGALTACMNCELNKYRDIEEFKLKKSKKFCTECSRTGKKLLKAGKFEPWLINEQLAPIPKPWDLEVADSGAKRFLAKGKIDNTEEYISAFQEFLYSSQVLNAAASDLFLSENFDLLVAHHGIYVPQGNMVESAKEHGVPVVTWVQGYRKQTFVLGIGDTYHKTLILDNPNIPELDSIRRKEIVNYLNSRDIGDRDWIRFGKVDIGNSDDIYIGDNVHKVLLMTNVSWDAQLHYKSRIFQDMHAWIEATINWFIQHQNLDLIIRIHPAEVTGKIKSRDPIYHFIASKFSTLPKNIIIVKPEQNVSTYKLMKSCGLGLIFATKAGIELAAQGVPIVVAGESWIRGKGLSYDPNSQQEYFDLLDRFSQDSNNLKVDQEAALKFAHFFFFQQSFEVKSIKSLDYYPYLRPNLKNDWDSTDPGLLRIILQLESLVA